MLVAGLFRFQFGKLDNPRGAYRSGDFPRVSFVCVLQREAPERAALFLESFRLLGYAATTVAIHHVFSLQLIARADDLIFKLKPAPSVVARSSSSSSVTHIHT